MHTPQPNHEDELLLTFHDLLRIIKKNARKIGAGAAIVACLAFCYAITRPTLYLAEATFRDKAKSDSGIGKSLLSDLVGSSHDSDVMTLMKSRSLMEDIIKQMNWQLAISKKEINFPFLPVQTIKNNLLAEYAVLRKLRHPIIKEHSQDIKAELITYNGEVPLNLKLKITSPTTYALTSSSGKAIGIGAFDQPFQADNFSFTLHLTKPNAYSSSEFNLTLLPLGKFAEALQKEFVVETDLKEKGLIKLSYKHPNRHEAAAAVNALMNVYSKFINDEHQRTCCLQIDYLVQRQQTIAKQLSDIMEKHADDLSKDMSSTGFATSGKAMEFLAHNQQNLKQKLLAIDLDIQRYENMNFNDEVDYENIASANLPEAINRLATEIRGLKQNADALNLALHNSPSNAEAFQQSFSSQILELNNTIAAKEDAALMLASLKNDEFPKIHSSLLDNPKFIVKLWSERAERCHTALLNKETGSKTEWQQCKEGFASYLTHLIYYLNIYQHNIEEHLAHQQTPLAEFQGINLGTAKDLFITYSKELSETESQAIQKKFIIGQIAEPSFEISSLSTVLDDPISKEMISKASGIILALKDADNRSNREQERLKADLAIQKGFLTTHLEQSLQLLKLRQQFLKDKILSLQSINLSLTQEQIALLENQINKFITNAIFNLKQEQKLLTDNLDELHVEMAAFPKKRAAEQLIEHQMVLNQMMVEEITRLVETKNITNNLEKIQSSPLDLPIVPLHPKSPRLILLTLLGAILGAIMSTAWVLATSIAKGVETSAENLRMAGFTVSGSLTNHMERSNAKNVLLDEDLETLRRTMAFITDPQVLNFTNCYLLLHGNGPQFAKNLAELMSKKGLKTLIVDLCFEDYSEAMPGLLQYLEGKTGEVHIQHEQTFDRIVSGGVSRYASELIGATRFAELMEKLSSEYNWVLVVSKALPQSAEAEALYKYFNHAIITVTGQSWSQLKPALDFARHKDHRVSFLMANPQFP